MRLADLIRNLLRRSPKRQVPKLPTHPRLRPAQPGAFGQQFVIGGVPPRRVEPPNDALRRKLLADPHFKEASPSEYGGGYVIGGQSTASKDT